MTTPARTPAQIAEAPSTDPTHPAVAERVFEDMAQTAGWIDRIDAAAFATDDGWTALQRLAESVEAAQRYAEKLRPIVPG